MKKKHLQWAAALLTVLMFGLGVARAELRKVEQVVFGMDCAPCAYGLEAGLKKLEGVKAVAVSLNRGLATIELKPGNRVTIEDIKEVVRKNGFTPKETKILEKSEPAQDQDPSAKK